MMPLSLIDHIIHFSFIVWSPVLSSEGIPQYSIQFTTSSLWLCLMRSVQKVSSHIVWKIETFIEEDTRYTKHCAQDNDVSVPFKVGTLGPHTILPITISYPVIFSYISLTIWNLFPFKGDFSFGKSQKLQGTKSGLWEDDSPGWFDDSPKNSAGDTMH